MLQLDPMTEDEFVAYRRRAVVSNAEAHARAGECDIERSLELSEKQYQQLLPRGIATDHQYLYTARDPATGEAVGIAWLQVKGEPGRRSGYIFDVEVQEALRGRGLGRRLMETIEAKATELGAERLFLNVFGWNTTARALYESMGYTIGGIGMVKQIAR